MWYSTVEDYSAGHQILADPMRVVAVTCSTYFRIELVTIMWQADTFETSRLLLLGFQ